MKKEPHPLIFPFTTALTSTTLAVIFASQGLSPYFVAIIPTLGIIIIVLWCMSPTGFSQKVRKEKKE